MQMKLMVGMLVSAAVLSCADTANAFVYAHDRSVVWNGTTTTWADANSWDNVQGSDLGFPGLLVGGESKAYAMIDSGTAAITPGDAPAEIVYRSYIGGTGGATLNVSEDSNFGRFYTGWSPGETGTLNLTAGTMTMDSANFHLGNEGNSVATISGGTMNAIDVRFASLAGSTSDFELSGGALNANSVANVGSGNLILAYYAGSISDFKVSGGTLTAERLWMRSGVATLDVSGSGSTINVDRFLVGTTGHKMKVGLDAGGVTTINAVGDILGGGTNYEGALLDNLAIEVNELPGFSGTAGSTYDIVSSATTLVESGLTVTDTIPGLDFTWAIVTDGGNEVLRLTAVAAPIAGDFDGDNDVDGADFIFWQRNTSIGNLADWKTNFGVGGLPGIGASVAAVPEPSAISLLALAIGIGVSFSNRKK